MIADMIDEERFVRSLVAVGSGSEFRYRCIYDPSPERISVLPSEETAEPRILLVAGPEGAGKSSVIVAAGLDAIEPRLLNPDNYARGLEGIEDLAVRYRLATDACMVLCDSLLEKGMSFGMEAMGNADDLDIIRRAKEAGYRIVLVFVSVDDPGIAIARVGERAAMGGRPLHTDAVVSSYRRSMDLLPELFRLSDRAVVLDNSGEHPVVA